MPLAHLPSAEAASSLDVALRAEVGLRRALAPIAITAGLAASIGALSQLWMGPNGHFRALALTGHLTLLSVGIFWLRRPPIRAHAAAAAVACYLSTMIGTFVLQAGQPTSIINLGVVSLGCSYLILNTRPLLAAQVVTLGWFAVGVASLRADPAGPESIEVAGLIAAGGVALRIGRLRLLRELDDSAVALQHETEERHRAQAKALQAERFESAAVMAGGLAHDLNNLLVGVVGGADLIEAHHGDAATLSFGLESIRKSATASIEMCQKMLDIAGGHVSIRGPLDLNRAVRDGVELADRARPRATRIIDACAPTPVMVVGDAAQVRQVVMNLVINGVEATADAGGQVRVSTAIERGAPAWALFVVEDTGPGIPADVQRRMFDPFFTTKFIGRGLGLSVVAGVVRSHRGGIEVISSAAGTRFEVRLPLHLDDVDAPPPAHAGAPPPRGLGTILLVDDEPLLRRMTRRLLEEAGYAVIDAASGDEAVRLLAAASPAPRVAIVDASLRDASGGSVAAVLQTVRPGLRVLVSSGYAPTSQAVRGSEGLPFLAKPYGRDVLLAALRSLTVEGEASA